jgi:cell division inhibitor SulA/protein ImuA
MDDGDRKLARLLEHPAIWRGRAAARADVRTSGYAALDEHLPGGGWPRHGLIEVLVGRFGSGELQLLLPSLAAATQSPCARWCVWVAPPLMPFAPALVAQGVVLERVAVVGGERPLWAFEQVLGSGACDAALAWVKRPRARDVRRLQLAAERGRTLGVLFRPQRAARESSAAQLRLSVQATRAGVRVGVLKGRSAARGSVKLTDHDGWPRL